MMRGQTNDPLFAEYAMEGGAVLEGEMPEYGYDLPEETEPGKRDFILRWRRRMSRPDVTYQVSVSSDLKNWTDDAAGVEEVGVEPDADGVMETVRTRIRLPESMRVFIGVRARRK
jgi:hypothetical protein